MKRILAVSAVLAVATLGASGTAMAGDPVVGAVVGGGIGAVIGHAMGGRDGAVVGSIIGAGTGAAVATDNDGRVVGYEYDDAPAPVVYAQPRVVYVPARRVVYEEPPVVVRPRGYVVAYRNYGHGYYYGREGRWDDEHGYGDRGWHHGWDRHRHGDDD
jgi:uncharacterized protein YcfJ